MEKSINTYGVFWIPSPAICEKIRQIKQAVIQIDTEADYVQHPVHSTLFLFNSFQLPNKVEMAFEQALKATSSFEVSLQGWQIFLNDQITQKHTLTWGIQPNHFLSKLQVSLAEALVQSPVIPIAYPVSWTGAYQISYEKWGFPFVGTHWIPHITVASVKSEAVAFAIQQEFPLPTDTVRCSEFALFLINGHSHTLIQSHHLFKL